jgi:hypothetical protein
MKPLLFFFAIVISFLSYQVYSLSNKVATHNRAVTEIARVITNSGLVVPDVDGKPEINTLLLEAWKQSHGLRTTQ